MVEVGLRLWHIASRGSVTFRLSTSDPNTRWLVRLERVDWSGQCCVPRTYVVLIESVCTESAPSCVQGSEGFECIVTLSEKC